MLIFNVLRNPTKLGLCRKFSKRTTNIAFHFGERYEMTTHKASFYIIRVTRIKTQTEYPFIKAAMRQGFKATSGQSQKHKHGRTRPEQVLIQNIKKSLNGDLNLDRHLESRPPLHPSPRPSSGPHRLCFPRPQDLAPLGLLNTSGGNNRTLGMPR